MSREEFTWSVMKYDLKTGLDVLKLPCFVKLADDRFQDERSPGERRSRGDSGCELQLEKKCCVWYVRARVMDLPDVDWFIHKKGEEFVKYHAQLAGSEILIPLEFGGKVRLYDRTGGKEYLTVTKLIEDFPRLIKAVDDMICASPGDKSPQIVKKGTVLELDRITKNTGTYRGHRETFLICKDKENNRELAFRYLAAVNFVQVPDTTKSVLKDLIEHLPLPQTVEFLNINPYDVISVDDDDAKDLLIMLSGPVQLLGLQMENFIVGRVNADNVSSDCDNSLIAFPEADHVLETFNVRLPCDNTSRNSYKVRYRSNGTYVSVSVGDDRVYDCLHEKLYLRCDRDETPLIVRSCNTDDNFYDNTEPPDTPPIPEKYDGKTLTPSISMPLVTANQKPERPLTRKRFFSANDIGKKAMCTSDNESRRGLKTYISHFSRRMKSTASQILFGLDAFSGAVDSDLAPGQKRALSFTESAPIPETPRTDGFVCYVDYDTKKSNSVKSDTKSNQPVEQSIQQTYYSSDNCKLEPDINSNSKQINHVEKPVQENGISNSDKCETHDDNLNHNSIPEQKLTSPEQSDEVIYAKVDILKKSKYTTWCHSCPVCNLTL